MEFKNKCKQAKHNYYDNIVKDLKTSSPGQWYSKVKRMSCNDKVKTEEVIVQSLAGIPDKEQAEIIADQFAKVSNQYEPLNKDLSLIHI